MRLRGRQLLPNLGHVVPIDLFQETYLMKQLARPRNVVCLGQYCFMRDMCFGVGGDGGEGGAGRLALRLDTTRIPWLLDCGIWFVCQRIVIDALKATRLLSDVNRIDKTHQKVPHCQSSSFESSTSREPQATTTWTFKWIQVPCTIRRHAIQSTFAVHINENTWCGSQVKSQEMSRKHNLPLGQAKLDCNNNSQWLVFTGYTTKKLKKLNI